MLSFLPGTLLLILIGLVLLYFEMRLCSRIFPSDSESRVKRLVLIAFGSRLLWAIVFLLFVSNYCSFAIRDDESYYLWASGLRAEPMDNAYGWFLPVAYSVFGVTSLTGRIINLFLSTYATAAFAYIELEIVQSKRLIGTLLYSIMPFQVFFSFFEIKDVMLLTAYAIAYALLISLRKKISVLKWIAFVALIVLCEETRSGMGAILALVAMISILGNVENKFLRAALVVFIACAGAAIAYLLFGTSYGEEADRYSRWSLTTYSSDSIYQMLRIDEVSDLWKLPFACLNYVVRPLGGLYGEGRLFFDYGFLLRAFDLGINIVGLFVFLGYARKEGIRSLIPLLPIFILVILNPTNIREGLFVFPYLYISFSLFLERYCFSIKGKRTGQRDLLVLVQLFCGICFFALALGPFLR